MPAFVNPDTIHRASTGLIAPATWGDVVNDDLNALETSITTINGEIAILNGDASWTTITAFSNGWVAGTFTPAYKKVGTRVWFKGQIKSGTVGSVTAFTMPTNYITAQTGNFPVYSNGAFGALNVFVTTGVIQVGNGSNVSVSLENFSYDTV
jgi:hypothetical protein